MLRNEHKILSTDGLSLWVQAGFNLIEEKEGRELWPHFHSNFLWKAAAFLLYKDIRVLTLLVTRS